MTQIRVTVQNTSETGGTFLTPTYFGFHDGSFDLFNAGEAASSGLESLAEDGSPTALAGERVSADADSQGLVITGAGGPIATQETTSSVIDVDALSNGYVSYAAMILPSNDAFIGNDDALRLFDEAGNFIGEQRIVVEGSNVYDAGTEVNTELEAAFLNQSGPNTGTTENGVVRLHEGFNGSVGNPDGEGDQLILGGENAAGAQITDAADFTAEGAQIAVIHINTFVEHVGTDGRDVLVGAGDDDLVRARDGDDVIRTNGGWDEVFAGGGNDVVLGGAGNDILWSGTGDDATFGGDDNDTIGGGEGNDAVFGDAGDDVVFASVGSDTVDGGAGDDLIFGGDDDDLVTGGAGDDEIYGGNGNDVFVFDAGHGDDSIGGFESRGDNQIDLSALGLDGFDDLGIEQAGNATVIDTGEGTITLWGTQVEDITVGDFLF